MQWSGFVAVCCAIGLVAGSCSSSSDPQTPATPRRVVTADWLNQSLTVLDYAKLVDGQSDAQASILREIDLSSFEPGPIEVEITPDGSTAVVSVGPAFFDGLPGLVGSPTIPEGGTLLIVDLDSGAVDEVQTEDVPLGIAISPDGSTAYTANYGVSGARGDSLSVIDIPGRRILEEVTVGSGPEQVALSPDGSLGIINIVSGGGVRIFETADVSGTLSEVLQTGDDPSDVTFLDGNDRAVVANTFSFDVTLLDTSDPSAPNVLDSVPIGAGIAYGVTYVQGRNEILATAAATGTGFPTFLVRFSPSGDSLAANETLELAGENFPLTAAATDQDFAFVAHIVDHQLSIIDLSNGQIRAVRWLTEPGPSYVAVQP
jgi:YVTN family beta-propeller protein